jgi:hypothetical protein
MQTAGSSDDRCLHLRESSAIPIGRMVPNNHVGIPIWGTALELGELQIQREKRMSLAKQVVARWVADLLSQDSLERSELVDVSPTDATVSPQREQGVRVGSANRPRPVVRRVPATLAKLR